MWFPAFLSYFLLFFVLSTDTYAKNNWPTCPENGAAPSLFFKTSQGALNYSNQFDSAGLKQIRGRAGSRLGPLWTPTGLTTVNDNYNFQISTKTWDLGRGRYCAVLERADLFIGYNNITVYVSNKYPRGSCEYNSILSHENTHVAIFREALFSYENRLRDTFQRTAQSIGPIYMRSPQAATNQIKQLLDARLQPVYKQMIRERDRRNAKIDTKTNYRREQSLCANW